MTFKNYYIPPDMEPKHYLFNHTEGYYVCPECGEIVEENLPEDEYEREELLSLYQDHQSSINNGLIEVIWILAIVLWFGVFVYAYIPSLQYERWQEIWDEYYHYAARLWRRRWRTRPRFTGPFMETCFSQLLCLKMVTQRWFYRLAEATRRYAREEFAEGIPGFLGLWVLRLFLWCFILLITHFYRPQIPDPIGPLFERLPITIENVEIVSSYVSVSNLLFYIVFAVAMIKEIYAYRRFRVIQWLNGYGKVEEE